MIRTVISDLGRVVLWFDNGIFLRKLAALVGIPFERAKAIAHENLELIPLFDSGAVSPREFKDRVFKAIGGKVAVDDATFWPVYKDIFWPNEPVIRTLQKVKAAGYKLVLLSNTDPERFGFVRERFPEIMMFDAYTLSYELQLIKPDPLIYLDAARRAGSRPEECVFIDDMEENVTAARATGLSGIHYRPDTDLEAELKKLGLNF